MTVEQRTGFAKETKEIVAHLFFVAALFERRKSLPERWSQTVATVTTYPDVSATVCSPASATAMTSISTRAPFGSAAT